MDRVREPAARERLSRLLLLPLLLGVVLAAATARWHSSVSVDNRTYLEMIVGIAQHGVPYTANGPVGRYPELQARWNRVQDGRLWGTLPPVFPYLATPAFRLGGVRGVVRFSVLMLGVLALGVYATASRLARDGRAGTAAAYLCLLGTPITTLALDTSPYVLATALIAWAAALGLRALDAVDRREALRWSAGCGLLSGLAAGSHPLAFPTVAALMGALGFASARSRVEGELPRLYDVPALGLRVRRESVEQACAAACGFALAMLPVAALNRVRFGSVNPITYGPCVWRSCAETGLDRQSIGAMLKYAAPAFAWAASLVALHLGLRRAPIARRVAIAGVLLAVVPASELHERVFGLATTLWAFVGDLSAIPLGFGIAHDRDGLGNFFGPWVIKAALQSSPVLLVAALAPAALAGRARVLLLGLPVVALLAALAMRANLPPAYGLGFPFLNVRYAVPAAPLLVALVAAAAWRLPWRRYDAAVGAGALAVAAWYLGRATSDFDRTRRVVMLWGSLGLALAALVAGGRAFVRGAPLGWRRAAAVLVAVAAAYSVAVNMALDLRVVLEARREGDRRVDAVARLTPQRFALVGWPPDIDPVLALRATRDIEYADLYENTNWANFRSLIDVWTGESRPIFALFSTNRAWTSPWPEVSFTLVDAGLGLYRIERR